MRMTNDADQTLVRSAVSEAAASQLAFVPSLGAQEAIGIGEGMPLLARITFSTLSRGGDSPERLRRARHRGAGLWSGASWFGRRSADGAARRRTSYSDGGATLAVT